MSDWKQWINDYKQENPDFLYHDDEEVYRRAAKKNLIPKGYRVPELDDKFGITPDIEPPKVSTPPQNQPPNDTTKDISLFSQYMQAFGDIIPEERWYTTTMQAAHAKSLGAAIASVETGKPQFK